MAKINIYEFSYDYEAEVVFEVDEEKYTEEIAKEILEFWSWEEPYDKEGDLKIEMLKKLALQCIIEGFSNNYNDYGVIREFDNKEGWPKLDGTHGIKLINLRNFEFYDSNLTYEVKPKEDS